jgi:hypothetical protein
VSTALIAYFAGEHRVGAPRAYWRSGPLPGQPSTYIVDSTVSSAMQ